MNHAFLSLALGSWSLARDTRRQVSHVFAAEMLAVTVACWLRCIKSMRHEPSLRFRFFTAENSTAKMSHTSAESPATQHDDELPPPSSRRARNRLTARQEWLQAELEQAAAMRKVDAA